MSEVSKEEILGMCLIFNKNAHSTRRKNSGKYSQVRNPGGKISANYAAVFFTCENLTLFLTVARQELLTEFRHLKSFSRNRPDRFFGVFRSGSQSVNHSLSLQQLARRQLSTLPCRFSTFQG